MDTYISKEVNNTIYKVLLLVIVLTISACSSNKTITQEVENSKTSSKEKSQKMNGGLDESL